MRFEHVRTGASGCTSADPMLLYRLAKGKDVHYICAAIHAAAMQMEDGSDELNALKAWHWQFFNQLAEILAAVRTLLAIVLPLQSALLVFLQQLNKCVMLSQHICLTCVLLLLCSDRLPCLVCNVCLCCRHFTSCIWRGVLTETSSP